MSIHITPDEVDYVHGILGQTLRQAEPSMLGGGVVGQITDAPKDTPVRPLHAIHLDGCMIVACFLM